MEYEYNEEDQPYPYIGQAVLILTEEESLFGHIDRITHGCILRISGSDGVNDFKAQATIGHPGVLQIRINPYAIPQLIDMALATGNKEDFKLYSRFMNEWEEMINSLEHPLVGYSQDIRKEVRA